MDRFAFVKPIALESRLMVVGGGAGLLSLAVFRFLAALASFSAFPFSFFRRSASSFFSFFLWP
jgi:hypothetical protein